MIPYYIVDLTTQQVLRRKNSTDQEIPATGDVRGSLIEKLRSVSFEGLVDIPSYLLDCHEQITLALVFLFKSLWCEIQ
jgi:hypothetical protein